jgi:glutamate racemase
MNTKPIAVFDSGVGGISVLRELVRLMPNERFLYFGDSANAPYGTRSTEEIRTLTQKAVQGLLKRHIKALVVACNTATAASIDSLRAQYPELIIIGIEPAVKPAVRDYPNGTVGIMATPATLREEKLQRLLAQNPHPNVQMIAAPGMMELVEAGLANSPQMDAFLTQLLNPYKEHLDALVLGCTHYPFAKASIRRVIGPKATMYDGGVGTAKETRRRLTEANLLNPGQGCVLIENSLDDPHIIRLCNTLLTEAHHG